MVISATALFPPGWHWFSEDKLCILEVLEHGSVINGHAIIGSGEIIMRTGFMERRGRIEELDRSFDLKFWLSQPAKVCFDAAWEMILHAWRVKGNDVRQLRLHRSVETFQRQKR